MVCIQCGANNPGDSAFCASCGTRLPAGKSADDAADSIQTPSKTTYPPAVHQAQSGPSLQGSNMLKTTSILFIICGSICALMTITVIISDYIRPDVGAVIGIILAMPSQIIAGIMGLKKYADPAAALFFILSGSLAFPVILFGLYLMNDRTYFPNELSQFTFVAGAIVLPILYIVGGAKLKKGIPVITVQYYGYGNPPQGYPYPPQGNAPQNPNPPQGNPPQGYPYPPQGNPPQNPNPPTG